MSNSVETLQALLDKQKAIIEKQKAESEHIKQEQEQKAKVETGQSPPSLKQSLM